MNVKVFYVLRYTLVEEGQARLFAEPLPTPKGYAICGALTNAGADVFFRYWGVQYSFVGFQHIQGNSRFLLGKFAKLKKVDLGEYEPGDIKSDSHDNWIPLNCLIDCESQHILIEKKVSFADIGSIMSIMSFGLNRIISDKYNCKVFIKGITNKHLFWNIVDESERIYALELKLLSPNLLDANLTARASLAALKMLFTQDTITITLKNDAGNLSVPVQPTNDYIDYISEGEGEWKIVRMLQGVKRKFYSRDSIKTIDVPPSNGSSNEVSPDSMASVLIDILNKSRDEDG
ncbi:hypothetical protein [Geomonas oryzae]|uniref:hypothetical protein n=1 Tax=Geomonas oryzae TaxID=2364273 RepID=UPI00100A401E|nr:hypothetical protein [Geomonas oryzae]